MHLGGLGFKLALLGLLTACVGPGLPRPEGGQPGIGGTSEEPRGTRALIIGVTSGVDAFSNMGGTTTTGGWVSVSEVHSNALITSDLHTRRPIGRLAEKVPSLDDGSIAVRADGRMRVVFPSGATSPGTMARPSPPTTWSSPRG